MYTPLFFGHRETRSKRTIILHGRNVDGKTAYRDGRPPTAVFGVQTLPARILVLLEIGYAAIDFLLLSSSLLPGNTLPFYVVTVDQMLTRFFSQNGARTPGDDEHGYETVRD